MTTDHIPGKNGGRLRRIPKGTSGNPKGRPPKLPQLDKLMADVLGKEDKDGKTAAEAILEALLRKARRGDHRASEILLDRGYGKAKQTLDLDGQLRVETPIINVVVKPPSENVGK